MKISYEKLKNLVQESDIENLISSGAPSDEYASEVDDIYNTLLSLQDSKTDSVIAVISTIWARSFDLQLEDINLRLPAFTKIAKNLT
jgi:hypothetical protein